MSEQRWRVNEEIRAREVRLIDENGVQVGIVPIQKAQRMAREKGLDLVEVAPQANPPVCRILDYSKYKYEQEKKRKEESKKQKTQEVKEIRFRLFIDNHDFLIKLKKIREFLEAKHKVRVVVFFRGRELSFIDKGKELLDKVKEALKDYAVVERDTKLEGRRMSILFMPKRK
ncbi:translation initiation factor IF-3 [bacterium]|nr:translation initiation factor IF-3 [bacterium]